MLKSLQWKIVTMFMLLVLAVMIIAGTFLLTRVGDFYSERFTGDMERVFTDERHLSKFSAEAAQPQSTERIKDIIDLYSGSGFLGINMYRNYFIFDAKTGECLYSSDSEYDGTVEKTPNLLTAFSGEIGSQTSGTAAFMDYAAPISVGDQPVYVVYIKDDKTETQSIIENIFWIIMQALGWGILISFVLGLLLSRNITKPIVTLTRRAERLAQGESPETGANIKRATDEIGMLANTFDFMARDLYNTLYQVESEKTKMETILVNLTDGVIAFDLDGKVIHINPTAETLLEITDTGTVEFDRLFALVEAGITIGDIIYLENTKTYERTITLGDRIIKAFFASFRQAPDKDSKKLGGVVVALQDITEQQKLENARREFVANVSHELRTPLTTIKSYTETLLDSNSNLTSTESHFLSVVNSESDRMTRIVKDLLTLSRLDHGKEPLRIQRFDMRKMIEGVIEKLSIDAQNHHHAITFMPTTNLPLFGGDRDRLEQVLINILSNSIKYTPDSGRIEVFAGHVYKDLYIKVKDNGIGIPAEDLQRIFDRFFRVDKARTRQAGGTGLGLAIAKEIVEAHSGKIVMQSLPDAGSEVIITLPIIEVDDELEE